MSHIKVKVKVTTMTSFQFYVVHAVAQAGGLHATEMHSCLVNFWQNIRGRIPKGGCWVRSCYNNHADLEIT